MSAQLDWQRGPTTPTSQSTFVTVVAWIFIGLSAGSTLISILQNVLLNVVFSSGFPVDDARKHMPPLVAFLFGHVRLYFLAFLLVSVATLCTSIGLLLRREWARIALIGILAFGILWMIGGIVLQQWLLPSIFDVGHLPAQAPPEFEAGMRGMMMTIRIFSALWAIVISVLYGWIIWRLRSPAIAAEFG
jgi:hypothetical protein